MYKIPLLPLSKSLESKQVLKKLVDAHRALAELKGITKIIPNQNILISTLSLQEAKDSSAIENIITTHDELYKSNSASKYFASHAAKEVYSYSEALFTGYNSVVKHGLLTNSHILEIQSILEQNEAGFRSLPGTELKNDKTGEVVYTPPQSPEQIKDLMSNLEQFINDDSLSDMDPLIKMALIHHQFESIHPFYDGNGRTGRIINVLYLVKNGLLETPILYLSRYINQNKSEYYRLLQAVRENESALEDWILFILETVEKTSQEASLLVKDIQKLMNHHKNQMREKAPKAYSHGLLNNLFTHPYTKIEFVTQDLGIHRNTAKRHLDALVDIKLITKHKMGKENFYVNTDLFNLLSNRSL